MTLLLIIFHNSPLHSPSKFTFNNRTKEWSTDFINLLSTFQSHFSRFSWWCHLTNARQDWTWNSTSHCLRSFLRFFSASFIVFLFTVKCCVTLRGRNGLCCILLSIFYVHAIYDFFNFSGGIHCFVDKPFEIYFYRHSFSR